MAQGNQNNGNQPNHQQRVRERLQQHHENKVAHREEREQTQRERFTQQPTGPQAQHQAKASANVEYNPTIRGIRQELATSHAKERQDLAWQNQLGSEMAGAAQANEGANAAYATSLTQQLANANAQNAATLAQQQQANASFAATTGVEGATGQAAAAGANITNAENVALNAPVLAAGASQSGYLRNIGIAQKERGHELANEQFGARKAIRQDLQAAQKQKGQAYVGKLAELRESARKQELDRKAFELEGQQAATKTALEERQLAQTQREQREQDRTSEANSKRTAASSAASTAASQTSAEASAKNAEVNAQEAAEERRYKRTHGGRTPAEVAATRKEDKPSTSEVNTNREAAQNALAAAQTAIKALGKSPATYTAAEWLALEQHLTAPKTGHEPGAGIDPAVAKKVVERLKRNAEAAAPAVQVAEKAYP